jgi:hypothetical protein
MLIDKELDPEGFAALRPDAEIDATVEWLAAQPGLLQPYEDEWVAVADEKIVAHGKDLDEVLAEARRQGHHDPRLVPVMPYPFIGMPAW